MMNKHESTIRAAALVARLRHAQADSDMLIDAAEALASLEAENARLRTRLSDLEVAVIGREAERDGWMDSARQFSNGQDFYQGIVRQVGEMFGKEAITSDDGSVQDDVLALKVPDLVAKLMAESLARDARIKAEVLESLSKSSYSLYLDQLLRHIAFMADQYRSQAEGAAQ